MADARMQAISRWPVARELPNFLAAARRYQENATGKVRIPAFLTDSHGTVPVLELDPGITAIITAMLPIACIARLFIACKDSVKRIFRPGSFTHLSVDAVSEGRVFAQTPSSGDVLRLLSRLQVEYLRSVNCPCAVSEPLSRHIGALLRACPTRRIPFVAIHSTATWDKQTKLAVLTRVDRAVIYPARARDAIVWLRYLSSAKTVCIDFRAAFFGTTIETFSSVIVNYLEFYLPDTVVCFAVIGVNWSAVFEDTRAALLAVEYAVYEVNLRRKLADRPYMWLVGLTRHIVIPTLELRFLENAIIPVHPDDLAYHAPLSPLANDNRMTFDKFSKNFFAVPMSHCGAGAAPSDILEAVDIWGAKYLAMFDVFPLLRVSAEYLHPDFDFDGHASIDDVPAERLRRVLAQNANSRIWFSVDFSAWLKSNTKRKVSYQYMRWCLDHACVSSGPDTNSIRLASLLQADILLTVNGEVLRSDDDRLIRFALDYAAILPVASLNETFLYRGYINEDRRGTVFRNRVLRYMFYTFKGHLLYGRHVSAYCIIRLCYRLLFDVDVFVRMLDLLLGVQATKRA